MNSRALLVILTAVNLGLLGYQVLQPHLAVASTRDVPAVLRAHALEIVDASGRVRASINVFPENPNVIWNVSLIRRLCCCVSPPPMAGRM